MVTLKVLFGKKILALGLLLLMGFTAPYSNPGTDTAITHSVVQAVEPEGAWLLTIPTTKEKAAMPNATAVKIMEDGFFSVAYYDKAGKEFLGTYGGTYKLADGKITEQYEFNTFDTTAVGKSVTGDYTIMNDKMQLKGVKEANATEVWEKIQAGQTASPLAGAWRISGREDNGQMNAMQPGPRKTIKMLSGDRFQWIAFNSETAGFFGTGGGTFTTENGKYTENIEFFSRDSSRVGRQLAFDFEVKDGKWHHSGLSSTGKPINEVWQIYEMQ
ncbi:membrane or secreted protein [Pontibacter toksunensis]|uniref:Membrane or secreted protein n=1 Tax=Pontibacter toksunensis TaxID=1332631 RepID=A0ABW6BZT9_9BACT